MTARVESGSAALLRQAIIGVMSGSEASASGVPGNFRRAVERWERLAPKLAGHDLGNEINLRVQELENLFEPFDAIHLLGQFVLSETVTWEPDAYVESEQPGSAYVVELVAAVLVRRGSRAGASDPSPAIDAHVTEPARELVQEIAQIEGLRRYRHAVGSSEDSLATAQARTAVQHLMMRGPSWPDQEISVLEELFGPEHLLSDSRKAWATPLLTRFDVPRP